MDTMHVRALGGDRFAIGIRGHEVVVDQPAEAGGTDAGPTPTELFVAGLVSCVAFYANRFLARHEVCPEGLRVDADWAMAEGRPARVGSVTIHVTPPEALPAAKVPAFLAVSRACTVHNSLARTPSVSIDVVPAAGQSVGPAA